MSIQSLSALLAAILTFVIGWSAILRDRRQRQHVTFAIFCFNLCFWYLAHFFTTTLQSDRAAWVGQLFAILVPSSAERFFRAFLADDPRWPKPTSRPILIGTVVFILALFLGLFYPLHQSPLFYIPLAIFVFASLFHCIYLIYERQRAIASRPEAMRLTYLLYGGAIAVTLAATDFLPYLGLAFPTTGNVLTIIYVYFLSQTIFHHRLLDIKELLGKMVTLTALVLILTVVYGLLVAWVGRDQPGVFFFNTIVASFIILVLFEPLRTRVEDRVNRWMFAEKYAFGRRLRMLSAELANIIEVRTLVARVLQVLEDSARVTHCSVYLAAPAGSTYRLAGNYGPAPVAELDGLKRRLFFDRLREYGIITMEYLERELADQQISREEDAVVATRNIIASMEDLCADVCIPLLSDDRIVGLLNLRDDRLREAYATDELEQLRRMAAQAAITLRNSRLFEQMKERDRLAALGQMAAGLAHEIRNPLGAIKGAAQLLKPSPTDDEKQPSPVSNSASTDEADATSPDEETEYLEIIVEEVNRLDHVVSQFLDYARPDRGQRERLNINKVVHRTLQLLSSQTPDEIELAVNLAADLPQVRADAEQLRQVFINLAINAFQSMSGRGRLRVTSGIRRGFEGGSAVQHVEVSFADTGKGIAREDISDIFIPFFTTKEGGTGLGLPICQRIIENHQGTIELRSEIGKGSTFTIVLPTATETEVTQQLTNRPRAETLQIGDVEGTDNESESGRVDDPIDVGHVETGDAELDDAEMDAEKSPDDKEMHVRGDG